MKSVCLCVPVEDFMHCKLQWQKYMLTASQQILASVFRVTRTIGSLYTRTTGVDGCNSDLSANRIYRDFRHLSPTAVKVQVYGSIILASPGLSRHSEPGLLCHLDPDGHLPPEV